MNLPGSRQHRRTDSATGTWALTDDAMSAARAASRGRARGLSVAAVRRAWGSGGTGNRLWDAAQARTQAQVAAKLTRGTVTRALGPGRPAPAPPGEEEEPEDVTLKQLLRWLSFRGGAVVECCPAALAEMYASAESACKGRPGSPRNGNTLTEAGCGPDEDGSGCVCEFVCEGYGMPGGVKTLTERPSVDCSIRDYLGFGGFGVGGDRQGEPADKDCVEEPGDVAKCGQVSAQACDEFDSCSEPADPGEVSFYFIYSSATTDGCDPGDIALLTLLLDEAAVLITENVNLILHIVCRLFGPENARRVRDFFSEPASVEFRDSLPTVMSWIASEETLAVDCSNALSRTYYSTESTECASAFLAAIVIHELIHRLPDRFEHSADDAGRECEDSTRLARWLRDELFRRLGCAAH